MSETEQITQVQVSVTTDGMTESAQSKLQTYLQRFADDLVRETMRLEAAARAQDLDECEITSTMVVRANEAVRSPLVGQATAQATPGHVLFVQTIAFVAALVAGVFGSYLNSVWQWSAFFSVLLIAVTAQSSSAFMLWRRR